MSEAVIVAVISVLGSLLGGIVGGLAQRGATPLSNKWPIALGAIGGLLIGGFGAYWFALPKSDLAVAQKWPVIFLDTFSNAESAQNWTNIKRTGIVTPTFSGYFGIKVSTDGSARWAFPKNDKVTVGNTFLVSMEALGDAQTGCDYGITFRNNIKDEYYWFFINRDEDKKTKAVTNRYGLKKHMEGQTNKDGKTTDDLNLLVDEQNQLKQTPQNISPTSVAVLVNGERIKLYINGKFVDEVSDDDISGSSVGIGTIVCQWLPSGSFKFDKFQVQSP